MNSTVDEIFLHDDVNQTSNFFSEPQKGTPVAARRFSKHKFNIHGSVHRKNYSNIQGVPGGMCQTSGGYSLF